MSSLRHNTVVWVVLSSSSPPILLESNVKLSFPWGEDVWVALIQMCRRCPCLHWSTDSVELASYNISPSYTLSFLTHGIWGVPSGLFRTRRDGWICVKTDCFVLTICDVVFYVTEKTVWPVGVNLPVYVSVMVIRILVPLSGCKTSSLCLPLYFSCVIGYFFIGSVCVVRFYPYAFVCKWRITSIAYITSVFYYACT